tara:strand:+ start:36320 stop:37864 length:1545 start_codon:yes stop_codon:yes gene_type:complete
MVSTPTPGMDPRTEHLLKDLLKNIALLNKGNTQGNRYLRDNTDIISNNIISLRGLNESFIQFGTVGDRMRESFKKADAVQMKSLAQGTSMSRFLSENTKVLSDLNGGFFENAAELLKNFSDGIRDNSTDVNRLTNRMRLTGQNTGELRKSVVSLLEMTGNNIDSATLLIKSNESLSHNYLISSETLLKAVNSVKGLMQRTSLTGGAENTGNMMQALTTMTGGRNNSANQAIASLLVGPEAWGKRFQLGIEGAEDTFLNANKPAEELMGDIKMFLGQANTRLDSIVGTGYEANNNSMKYFRADGFIGGDLAVALRNVNASINNQTKISESMKADSDEILDSAKTVEESAKLYYDRFNQTIYPLLIKALPIMAMGSVVGNVGAMGAGMMGGRGGRAGVGGMLSILGPLGIAAGLGYTFWPEITKAFSSISKESKKQTKYQEEIKINTRKAMDKPKDTKTNLLGTVLEQYLMEVRSNSRRMNLQHGELQKQTRHLQKMSDRIDITGSIPSGSVGTPR